MLSWSTSHVVSFAWTMEAGHSKELQPHCSARATMGARFSMAAERMTRLAAQMKSMLTAMLLLPSSLMGSTTLPSPEALVAGLLGCRLPTWPSSPVPSSSKSTESMPPGERPTTFRGCPRSVASYAAATSSGAPSGTLWTFSAGMPNFFMKLLLAFLKVLYSPMRSLTKNTCTLLQSIFFLGSLSKLWTMDPPGKQIEKASLALIARLAILVTSSTSAMVMQTSSSHTLTLRPSASARF
mmetsp:Transcript_113279/g.331092  ORF Transcript_113279/g.331092 Transcript_113279/m.331092 type:complete len:239 (+) Transcript_113279:1211-1927(+)